jgi:hypothetical protein
MTVPNEDDTLDPNARPHLTWLGRRVADGIECWDPAGDDDDTPDSTPPDAAASPAT